MKNYFCGHWGFNDTPEDTKVLMDGEGASESSLTSLRPRGFTKEDDWGDVSQKVSSVAKEGTYILLAKLHF